MKKRIKRLIILFLIAILFYCVFWEKVIITREYVYVTGWNGHPGFLIIQKIIPSESLKNKKIEEIISNDISYNYSVDSSFCYAIQYNHKEKVDRIYFNRKSKNYKWRYCYGRGEIIPLDETIPVLELNTWYRLSHAGIQGYVHFVYIDKFGKVYQFELGVYKGAW